MAMNPALYKLMRLRAGGMYRRLARSMKTVQGLAFVLMAFAVFLLWVAPLIVFPVLPANLRTIPFSTLTELIAPALFGACMLTILLGDDKTIRFQPAEVDFLFPAPFSRRDLLAYKLIESVFGAAVAGAFFFVWLIPHVPHPVAAYLGSFLALLFVQLFQMVFVLSSETLSHKLSGVDKRYIYGTLAVVFVLAAAQVYAILAAGDIWAAWQRFRGEPLGMVLFAPFEAFSRLILAKRLWPDIALWTAVTLAINAALILIVLRLDKAYLDAALHSSQRFAAMVERVQRGGLLAIWGVPLRWRLPAPPRWGGVGPILWRQTTHAMRSLPTLLSMGAVVLFVLVAPQVFLQKIDTPLFEAMSVALMAAVFQLTLIFTMMLRFDFRGDLDQIDWLKTLPVSSLAVAVGQLIVPTLIATIVQASLLIGLSFCFERATQLLLVTSLFTLPVNLLLFALENLLFLLFPSRSVAFNPGDLQGFGHQIVLFIVKMTILFSGLTAAFILGTLVYLLTESAEMGVLTIWIVIMSGAIAIVPAVAWAFRRFDPSLDRPAAE